MYFINNYAAFIDIIFIYVPLDFGNIIQKHSLKNIAYVEFFHALSAKKFLKRIMRRSVFEITLHDKWF